MWPNTCRSEGHHVTRSGPGSVVGEVQPHARVCPYQHNWQVTKLRRKCTYCTLLYLDTALQPRRADAKHATIDLTRAQGCGLDGLTHARIGVHI